MNSGINIKTIKPHMIAFGIIIGIIITMSGAYAPSIGVIPTDIELGQVSRGTDVSGKIYLSTSGDSVTLNGEYIIPTSNPWFTQYIAEYSEEDISGWISFEEDEILVDRSQSFSVDIGGVRTKANKEAVFTISIPKNAEPGYHAGSINLIPVSDAGKGPEVTIFALARPNFLFRVNGDVKRELQIAKIEAERRSENTARIILTVMNTGTNTVSTDGKKSIAKIYNSDNEIRAELELRSFTIKPGQSIKASAEWTSSEEIKDGRYKVVANVNYRSGDAKKTDYVTVPSMITTNNVQGKTLDVDTEPTEAIPAGEVCTFNWTWIIIIALITALLYFIKDSNASMTRTGIIFAVAFIIIAIANYMICSFGTITGSIIAILIIGLIYYIKK